MSKHPDKPPEHFKVGEVVIHQGNETGKRKGEEYTIIKELHLVNMCLSNGTKKLMWVYRIDGEPLDSTTLPVGAPPEWLRKKYPPSELTFDELMCNLNETKEIVEEA